MVATAKLIAIPRFSFAQQINLHRNSGIFQFHECVIN